MKLPKILTGQSDGAAAAQAEVTRLQGQLDRLDKRLADAVAVVDHANAERRQLLVENDPTPMQMKAADAACHLAAESRVGVEDARRAVVERLEDAKGRHAALVDEAKRASVINECKARAAAINAAAERIADIARMLKDARIELEVAVAEHGISLPSLVFAEKGWIVAADGSEIPAALATPAALAARPVLLAAIRMAVPYALAATDGLGNPHPEDPLVAAHRGQSGLLLDHADDVRDGRSAPESPPRPAISLPTESRPQSTDQPTERVVMAVPFLYIGVRDRPVEGEAGDVEVPARVARVAREMGIAHQPGSDKAKAVLLKLKISEIQPVNGWKLIRPKPTVRHFIDTDADVIGDPIETSPVRTAEWTEERDDRRRPRPYISLS